MSEGNLTGHVGGAGLQDSWLPPPCGAPCHPPLCQALGAESEGRREAKKEEQRNGRKDGVGGRKDHLHTGPHSPVAVASAQPLNGLASAAPETDL